MRRIVFLFVAFALPGHAFAQDAVGCDSFKWPVTRERALLQTASANVKSGSTIGIPASARVELQRFNDAPLPYPPGRIPRDTSSFSGYIRLDVAKPGLYAVALTTNAWIDAIQNGTYLKTADFSGVRGCEAVRKVVRFQFDAGPLVLEFSGNETPNLTTAIAPAE